MSTPRLAIDTTTTRHGRELIDAPMLNKGTAFTSEERSHWGLLGLLPPYVETLDEQVVRAYEAFQRKDNDLERHIYLRALQDTNEVLFYRLLVDHIEEMMPIVYTPVVGQACEQFSHIYRRPRGLFIPYPLRDATPTMLRNRPAPEVDVVVVTDGERILGIGDQGVGGIGIPVGKLSLYTLIGGIHPSRTQPIVLDVGTNNQERLADPEYLGWRHERVTGDEYYDFVDRFVQAVKRELPNTCLQWEDFATRNARPILQRYRDQLLTFNDDIQGTSGVVLGAVLSALQVTRKDLRDQQIVMLGAGSSAIGVADGLRQAMIAEGLSEEEARSRFWIVNTRGILHTGRTDLSPEQRVYAQSPDRLIDFPRTLNGNIGLADVVSKVKATILIGLSTAAGAFTEPIVRSMAANTYRPVIFPLSNPTVKSEAKPIDLIHWTDGRALVATGSPYPPVRMAGRMIPIGQCNNVYIFPAIGLGVVAARARRITDEMILAAARALAHSSPARLDSAACLLPDLEDLRMVAVEIAVAVGMEAQRAGVAPQTTPERLRECVVAAQWTPAYSVVDAKRPAGRSAQASEGTSVYVTPNGKHHKVSPRAKAATVA